MQPKELSEYIKIVSNHKLSAIASSIDWSLIGILFSLWMTNIHVKAAVDSSLIFISSSSS